MHPVMMMAQRAPATSAATSLTAKLRQMQTQHNQTLSQHARLVRGARARALQPC